MQTDKIKPGMRVEVPQGIGDVLVIDHAYDTVLVQGEHPEQQWAVHSGDIVSNEQLHIECDRYY
ncbi:hypothetical protein [Vibrio ulleungensis]|jgi:hypothetical protein|uniref:Uncharacterized protein n=1 Tax=Vibrio ulleungensis TaxID=2807619 RepID=A0ABS2HN98_9VIBR|nr:hypothetical protein [Vibrio ulleungensis]MBM7037351.1 hypothetical protein [Vibrio ulleungensis]